MFFKQTDNRDIGAYKINEGIQNHPFSLSNSRETGIIKTIQQKMRNNDLVFTKADKSNAIVILEREAYVQKIESVIRDINYQERPDEK